MIRPANAYARIVRLCYQIQAIRAYRDANIRFRPLQNGDNELGGLGIEEIAQRFTFSWFFVERLPTTA